MQTTGVGHVHLFSGKDECSRQVYMLRNDAREVVLCS